jgi:hypothetical protein
MRKMRNKKCKLTITCGDREIVRAHYPQMSRESIDRRAVARAAARGVLVDSKSTADALDSLVLGLPDATLREWMKRRLKKAA